MMLAPAFAEVTVKIEQLNPADPAWKFRTIPGPAKSDLAATAKVTLLGNHFEPAAAEGAILVNGKMPDDSLDLSQAALLSNGNSNGGRLLLDLGRVQPIAAVTTFSWHEWDVDHGSRGPQVYTLYGTSQEQPDPKDLGTWVKVAEVDTRPNKTGENWNGQHGVQISETSGKLGSFRYLLFVLERTRSPLQPDAAMTGTLFAEIDVHSALTLANAGDAEIPKPAQVDHVWVVFKTHLDIGYTETIENVLKKYREPMMEGALEVIDASRSQPAEQRFSWTLAGWPLDHVLGPEQDPTRRKRIEEAVKEGAIAFHALPFTTHTETQDLEDLVRGLGYATRLAERYNRPLPISGKMTDVPSHSWIMPTLLAHAGVQFLQLGCNGTSAFVRVPHLFWWEGPDGSRVLCHYTAVYGSDIKPPRDWPSKHYLAMMMTGDNHGPPTVAEVEAIRKRAARILPGVQVHFGTLDDFATAVISENPRLEVVRADMPDTWIHGWLSMPREAKTARLFRPLEPALDTLDTQLRAWGIKCADVAPALNEAYRQSGLFSEHTFGPWGPNGGSWNSGTPRYLYGEAWKAAYARGAYKRYEAAFDDKRAFAWKADTIVRSELASRLDLLAQSVKAVGPRLVVYNALPWTRSGLVEIPNRPGQFLYARNVPASGYRTYRIAPAEQVKPSLEQPATSLETPFFKVRFDLKRGGMASLIDRETGRELVDPASPYALGQFLHERFGPEQMLAFHHAYGRPGYSWPKGDLPASASYEAVTLSEWTLTTRRDAQADVVTLTAADPKGLAREVSIDFTFPRRQPYVEVAWRVVDKTPDPIPEGGWLCFPFAVEQPQFRLGRLGGPMDPTRDIVAGANRHYFCLNGGLTISGKSERGIGLCPLDSSCVSLDKPGLWKFSVDETPIKAAVFVNLYNNEWNTNFPEWQDGSWVSRVRFWPTREGGLGRDLVVPAWEARLPLLAAAADGDGGNLPRAREGLRLSCRGVLVTAFGQNPDGPGLLLRVWEEAGQAGRCRLRLPTGVKARAARPVNLRGTPIGSPVPIHTGEFEVTLRPYAPLSFLLEP